MTCLLMNITTKQGLIARLANQDYKIMVEDPAITNPRSFYLAEMKPGEEIYATTPKRAWFCKITRRQDGTFKVD